jgi:hypothetical protein
LASLDREAGQEILRDKGLSGESNGVLITNYRGNPLMLKFVSNRIKDLFQGNVSEFLKQSRTLIFEDMMLLLKQEFDRLSEPERLIMEHLSVTGEGMDGMSLPELEQVLENINPCDIHNTLHSLRWRSLVESTTEGFTIHPYIREYVIYRLGEPNN